MKHSVSGACASTTPQGSTIIERPCHWSFGVLAPRWSGAITNTWFSIAAGADQRLPMVLAGRSGERRRQRDDVGAAQCLDPELLREAEVVTDRHANPQRAGVRDDDLLARHHGRGLLVGEALDVHVEEVDLAVGSHDPAVWRDQARGVRVQGSSAFDPLGDAPGEQPDAAITSPRAGHRDRGAVERLRGVMELARAAPAVEQLGQRDELGTRIVSGANEGRGNREVSFLVGRGGELDRRNADRSQTLRGPAGS